MNGSIRYVGLSVFLVLFFSLSNDVFATDVVGVMVPLYTYPGPTWDVIIDAKTQHQSVPTVAIINPHNGPGNATSANYALGIQKLQTAGIVVIGYVHTNYTNRDYAMVQNDIDSYKSFYPQLQGIFFDEMSNTSGDETYYRNLSNYAKSSGFAFTVGNPGTETIPSYIGTMDNIIIYETGGLPSLNALGGWHTNYDKSNFSYLAYGVENVDQTYVRSSSNYVGYVYLSNGTGSNPWASIPPYFETLLGSVGDFSLVTIHSLTVSGNPILGIWNEIYSNGINVKTGFTPKQNWLASGLTYSICVADYQNYVFDHWENYDVSRCKTTGITQNVNFTAYYKVYSVLNLQSVILNGTSVSGMWTEIYSNGTRVDYGFTPKQYQLLPDFNYVTCIGDYQNYVFDHWESGETTRCRLIHMNGDTTIAAYFKT